MTLNRLLMFALIAFGFLACRGAPPIAQTCQEKDNVCGPDVPYCYMPGDDDPAPWPECEKKSGVWCCPVVGGEGGGGAGGTGGRSTGSALCADWHYPPSGGQPFVCPDSADRCTDPSFGAMSVPVCCPLEAPCSAPAPAADMCKPMLSTFLGWCCLPEC